MTDKNQRRILEALAAAGEPLWLRDLEQRVYGEGITEVQRKSLHRSLSTLARRGLILRGRAACTLQEWQTRRHNRVKVWLPDHDPPYLQRTVSVEEVEQIILDVLHETDDRLGITRAELKFSALYPAPPWFSYFRFRSEVRRRLRQYDADAVEGSRSTVHRVLTRLEQEGRIERSPTWRKVPLFVRRLG